MDILLFIALGYLLFTSFIFFANRRDFTPLRPSHEKIFADQAPLVSIGIPARNEEAVIERCVQSALKQEYPNFEVIVLNDQSEDQTTAILNRLADQNENILKVIEGKIKPANWLGKPWACHQIAREANGNILMFIDADTWLKKDMVSKTVRSMGHDVVDFLTIWPMQELGSFWEKTIIPLVYYSLLTLLPARYVYKPPRWIPKTLRPLASPLFAAACGQCMAFKHSAYLSVGGHESVRDEVVEDVALAKVIKKHGLKMRMYHGRDTISCRMYTSGKELKQGFSKNFLAGFNHNIPVFITMALLHLAVFVAPFIILPVAIGSANTYLVLLSSLSILLILMHRIILARWFNWSLTYTLLHPLAVLWFQKLGLELLINYSRGVKANWKGRSIN